MESRNMTIRYIGLGAIGVAALALIVAALLRQPPELPPAVARGTAGQRDEVDEQVINFGERRKGKAA